jgi:hypothetical protein
MLLKGCPIYLSKDLISWFIKSALERDIFNVVMKLIDLYGFYNKDPEGINKLKNMFGKPNGSL